MSGHVTVSRAWSRAMAPGVTVGVAYFEIANSGPADELLGIASPACAHVQMHEMTMSNGMMHMRQADSVALPQAGHVVFGPNGLHAMLLDVKRPFKAGERVPLTLIFRHAGRVTIEATVQGPGGAGPAADGKALD